MAELLSRVLPLALGAAISPTVLAIGLLILCSPKRPVARGAAFATGVLIIIAGLSVVGLRFSHAANARAHPDDIARVVDLVAGLLLLLLALSTAVRMVRADRSATADPSSAAEDDGRRQGLVSAGLIGAAMMLTNLSSIILYLPAMHEIARSRVDAADKAIAVLVVAAITSLPATLPLAVRVAAPGPSQRWLSTLHTWVAAHSRQIALVIEVVLGVWLIFKAR